MKTRALFIAAAGLFGATAVALGAFAAHGVAGEGAERTKSLLDVGSKYQLIHAAVLLATALLIERLPGRAAVVAGAAFLIGNLVFPGALYAIAFTGVSVFGAVAPIGGMAYILGWSALAVAGMRAYKSGGPPLE